MFAIVSTLFFTACEKDKEEVQLPGEFEVEFDNVAFVNGSNQQLKLREVGSTVYDYKNGMEQDFNITFLRYYISNIVLEGTNGAYYEDKMSVDATSTQGYYLIDEANLASQLIRLTNVPAGKYNKITFTVGVEENGIKEGAAGGVLDPSTSGMFWNWNSGYVAYKIEGQSSASPGNAGGNTIRRDNPKGIVFHIGGWKTIEGTSFVNNNRRITLNFDTDAKVNSKERPHAHLFVNALAIFDGANKIDFTKANNVHRPDAAKPMADNMVNAFKFDHLHQ
jgi:hypothetical protein